MSFAALMIMLGAIADMIVPICFFDRNNGMSKS
jgi:hypothetical protein